MTGSRIRFLEIAATQVSDLDPIRELPLLSLNIRGSKVNDYSKLHDFRQVERLNCLIHNTEQASQLQSLNWVGVINSQSVGRMAELANPAVTGNGATTNDTAGDGGATFRIEGEVNAALRTRAMRETSCCDGIPAWMMSACAVCRVRFATKRSGR
ncbi:MAG: hypothetical protein O3A00_20725 [Planctomycetota bacterium]|nr:hypothetical protein [Planctomycetota bacterium]